VTPRTCRCLAVHAPTAARSAAAPRRHGAPRRAAGSAALVTRADHARELPRAGAGRQPPQRAQTRTEKSPAARPGDPGGRRPRQAGCHVGPEWRKIPSHSTRAAARWLSSLPPSAGQRRGRQRGRVQRGRAAHLYKQHFEGSPAGRQVSRCFVRRRAQRHCAPARHGLRRQATVRCSMPCRFSRNPSMDRRRGAPGPPRSTDEGPRRAQLLRAGPQGRHTAARPGQGCLQHAYAPHWAGRRPTFVRQLHQLLLQAAALLAAGLHHEHLRDAETTLCPAAPPRAPSARPNRAHMQAGGEAGAAGERAGSCHAARRRILSSNARAAGTHHAPGPLSARTHAQTGVLAGAAQPFLRVWANHMLSPSQTLLGRRSAAESQSPGRPFVDRKGGPLWWPSVLTWHCSTVLQTRSRQQPRLPTATRAAGWHSLPRGRTARGQAQAPPARRGLQADAAARPSGTCRGVPCPHNAPAASCTAPLRPQAGGLGRCSHAGAQPTRGSKKLAAALCCAPTKQPQNSGARHKIQTPARPQHARSPRCRA